MNLRVMLQVLMFGVTRRATARRPARSKSFPFSATTLPHSIVITGQPVIARGRIIGAMMEDILPDRNMRRGNPRARGAGGFPHAFPDRRKS